MCSYNVCMRTSARPSRVWDVHMRTPQPRRRVENKLYFARPCVCAFRTRSGSARIVAWLPVHASGVEKQQQHGALTRPETAAEIEREENNTYFERKKTHTHTPHTTVFFVILRCRG